MDQFNGLPAWEGLSVALISDCLKRSHVMDGGIAPVSGSSLVGPAFTAQTMVGDSSTLHRCVAQAPRGAVLVVDAGGYTDRAVWGEVLTVAALARHLAGAVISGAVRDVDAIRAAGFPLYARGVSPAGPHKGWAGPIGETIQCGGVVVRRGDLIVGDSDGVVVVPGNLIDSTLVAARERRQRERDWIERIRSGESSAEVLDLDSSQGSDTT